jgi:hypothetical protein
MMSDAERTRPKVFALTPYTALPYDNPSKGTQANGTYTDAGHGTAI